MATLIASFNERTDAARACEELVAEFPGVRFALHQSPTGERKGASDNLRSLIVEIVGVGEHPGETFPLEVVISEVSESEVPAVNALLLQHHASVRTETM